MESLGKSNLGQRGPEDQRDKGLLSAQALLLLGQELVTGTGSLCSAARKSLQTLDRLVLVGKPLTSLNENVD